MNNFHTISSVVLAELADFFDSSWPHADVDLLADSLIIVLHNNKQYVINKHTVTQQIWVSSPFTGAHHFSYHDGQWLCTRTGRSLNGLLKQEQELYAA